MAVVIRNGKVISVSGGSVISNGNLIVSGDVVGGRKVVQVDGMTIISGGDVQEIHQEHDGIRSITFNECDNVTLSSGSKLKVDGHGSCSVHGESATISGFTGSVQVPDIEDIEINLSSGSVTGEIKASNISTSVASGDVRIRMQSRNKSPRISARCASGDISITVL